MQLQGDGPVRLLVVECTVALDLRATAQWDAARTAALGADATLADLAGGPAHGRFVMTLDPKGAGTLYQGIVTLEGGSVAHLIEHYLATSEQLASRLTLSVRDRCVAGLIVQRLPGAREDDDATWSRVRAQLHEVQPAVLQQDAAQTLLRALFPEDDLRVFTPLTVQARCPCSRERVANALRIAGLAEIEAVLAERTEVEVICEFCNRRHAFAPDEARALFASAESTRR
jgi:molecular chaperone Hsp33